MADNVSPLILLTRPRAQSERFAKDLAGLAETCIVPLQEIVGTGPVPELGDIRGLIFTSENAVRFFVAGTATRNLTAWCVGQRTAQAAAAAGMRVEVADGSADALVAQIQSASPASPLLHLHGHHTRGDVAARLTVAGVPTRAAELYDQRAINPDPPIAELTRGRQVLAPLFSPRSAQLLAHHVAAEPIAWHFACLSEAVRLALPARLRPMASVAQETSAKAMVKLLEHHISP